MTKTVFMAVCLAAELGFGSLALAQEPEPPAMAADVPTPGAEDVEPYANTVPVSPLSSEPVTEPESAQEDSKRAIDEVIVTARRTAESQQDVPVSITAFSADSLAREQINGAQDLQGRVPSMTIGSNSLGRNTETPTVRGQGASFGSSPGVVIYFAEVPVPSDYPGNGQGGPGKFFDVSNLQVLKGSQGTLFGRNTTGGALLIEPHKPEDTFSSSLSAEGSSYSGQSYEAIINVPLVDDTLLMRAAGKYVKRDGFTEDVGTGRDIDDKNFWTARLGITWRPTDRVENYVLGQFTYSSDHGTSTVIEGFNKVGLNYGLPATIAGIAGVPTDLVSQVLLGLGVSPEALTDPLNIGCAFFNLTTPSTNCGDDIVAAQQARGIRKIETSLAPFDRVKTGSVIDQFRYDITDEATIRNIASYATFTHAFGIDADGSIARFQDLDTPAGHDAYSVSQITEELQLQGSLMDARLKYVVGGYYQHVRPNEDDTGQQIAAFNFPAFLIPPAYLSLKQTSYAPYAQGTYDMSSIADWLDGLSFTAGVRYTTDETTGESSAGGTDHSATLKSTALTYTGGLDYKFGANLLYGKISRGYKAGGFAAAAVDPADYTYTPEYVTNYEIGQKSDFEIAGVPARVNSALYYTDYTDLQRGGIDKNGSSIGSAIFTVGSAAIYGFELEATVEPLDGFRLSANYAYAHGSYNEFNLPVQGANPQLDCTGQKVPEGGVAKLDCAPFANTPRNQASVSASYEIPIDVSLGLVDASVTYAWTGTQYSSGYSLPDSEPGAYLEDHGLLNASLSWSKILGSSLDFQLFGTNLTDEDYRIANSNVWNLIYFRASTYGEPRILGAKLTYRWGD